ncbi:TetR/AcrR family transcriptional regulator [Dactylosporangium sp. CS-033363]|uniref:TetR/AcrR family transcriptional regulator n=1 Tax=Dactylosporangium sp. CS-033363 TaxID=3239935 RepID=UPI003D8E0AD2
MNGSSQNRRERLRAFTVKEIKTVATTLMTRGGPDAVTLRAIARHMGLTPSALYAYYPTRDALITALTIDESQAMVDAMETARDALPADDKSGRLQAWVTAFRTWAMANPAGFRLVFGDPISGYRPPNDGTVALIENRACAGFIALVAAAWPLDGGPAPTEHEWTDFPTALVQDVRAAFPAVPPAAAALALRQWAALHGLLALEIRGRLSTHTRRPEKLYKAAIMEMLAALRLSL